MIEIEVQQIPNQQFLRIIDNKRYLLKFRTFKNMTLVDVEIDGVAVKRSLRACPNSFLIPYPYLENGGGNFMFVCNENDYPFYTKFGVTQQLVYLTPQETEEIRNAKSPSNS